MSGTRYAALKKSLIVFFFLIYSFSAYAIPRVENIKDIEVKEKLGDYISLDLSFRDEDGNVVKLADLFQDELPTILTLSYYECRMVCTYVLNGVLDVVNKLDSLYLGQDFKIVTVSFNHNDTPELAKIKAANYRGALKNSSSWKDLRFLTGDEANINRLTQAVGFRFKKYGDQFRHDGIIVILTHEGEIFRYFHGTHYEPNELRQALLEAHGQRLKYPLQEVSMVKAGVIATVLSSGFLLAYFFLRRSKGE